MVENLVSNAIKFTPDGGAVTISASSDGELAEIAVADTGIGIPAEDRGRLFERMFRAREAERRHIQGTGLGLTIVKAIVDAHGGTDHRRQRASARGRPSGSSCPSRTAPGPTGARSRAARPDRRRGPTTGGPDDDAKLVVVADDERDIVELVAIVLGRAGYEVITAADGERRLELIRERRPDLCVLDGRMPGLAGYEILERASRRRGDRGRPRS